MRAPLLVLVPLALWTFESLAHASTKIDFTYDLRPAPPLDEAGKSYRFELPGSDCSQPFERNLRRR